MPQNRLAELLAASDPPLTRRSLAATIGVHEATVGRWAAGLHAIPQRHWQQISELLGVTPAYLLGLEDNGGNGESEEAAG